MSSPLLPREHLAALKPWELDSFDPAGRRAPAAGAAPQLPTAGQIERLHQQAHEEGYAAGYKEGREAAARLQQLAAGLDLALRQFDERAAEDVLTLSLTVAKQMLREALKLKPELVLPCVQEALRALPQARDGLLLVMHPADAALAREHLGEHLRRPGWQLVEDARVARGGCRVETAGGELDATLETRWREVLAVIGRTEGWLE
ncbi:MAG: FliH/SctL family protein [Betaproteobacteria bacterium]|nr:FliH/SctL family protein [Betaproteobacteria bacterium]